MSDAHAGDPPPWIFQCDVDRLMVSVGGRTRTESVRNGLDGHATYLGSAPSCVHDIALGTGSDDDGGCTSIAVSDAAAPSVRQPQLRTIGSAKDSTIGIAFRPALWM